MNTKTTTKQAIKNIKESLLAPQPRPFIVDAAVNYAKRRKKRITLADIGRMQAVACGAGRFNDFCDNDR